MEITPETMARLHESLALRADATHLLDVSYRTLDTPIGTLLLAATEHGLVRVAFDSEGHADVLSMLANRISPRILHAAKRLDPAARELDEYFSGTRRGFDLPLDLQLTRGFQREVLRHLPEISYGRTESYGKVATAVGSPRAARAVGTACALNPLPIVVPCHRVIRSDGTLGPYRGGTAAKETLLGLETRHTRPSEDDL
jgi:methylated-DNA-[protein]-cysteine S-methyltransferase